MDDSANFLSLFTWQACHDKMTDRKPVVAMKNMTDNTADRLESDKTDREPVSCQKELHNKKKKKNADRLESDKNVTKSCVKMPS